ncbi:MAG: O-antigen ligase domain-containing protein, partial [Pseudorhodoplanes sp.]
LGAFVNHGWIGGFAYIGLVLTTIYAGFRFSLVRTPWQGPLIALYCSFIGLAAESFIVDTDHGRLYYQLLGVVWGLIAATIKFQISAHLQARSPSATIR